MRKEDIMISVEAIANYSKQKIIDGNFKYISKDEYSVKVLISNIFELQLWTKRGITDFELFDIVYIIRGIEQFKISFNGVTYKAFNTDAERLQAWSNIEPFINK